MNLWIEKLFKEGSLKGFIDQEIYFESSESLRISVYQGEVEKFNLSEQGGLSYRGIVNGKMGYAFTESFDDSAIEMLVNEAYANAMLIEATDEVFLHDGSGEYAIIDQHIPEDTHSVEDKINFMIDLEKKILSADKRILRMSGNSYSESVFTKRIKNTKGLDLNETKKLTYAYAIVVANENEDTRTGIGVHMADDFSKLSTDEIAKMAVDEALGMLGAKPIPSLKCPVVFENKTFASFLSQFTNHFSAENVQKKLSALGGKLNTKIASELVTITDNPHLEHGMLTTAFDAEGVATYVKPIIEKGILKTYLHNLKTANIDKVKSTGNAAKGSYKSSVEIAPSNLCFESGDSSLENLIAPIENGIYLNSVQGLHAGINSISGDFSLQCSGYSVQNGKMTKPVSQITVSGNFFELLKTIDGVGNDFLDFPLNDGTASPSIRIKELSISGL